VFECISGQTKSPIRIAEKDETLLVSQTPFSYVFSSFEYQ